MDVNWINKKTKEMEEKIRQLEEELKIAKGIEWSVQLFKGILKEALNSEIPELAAKLIRKFYEALLKEGFSKTEALEIIKNTFVQIPLR